MSFARWLLVPSALLATLIGIPYAAAVLKDAVWCSALGYLYWDPFWDDVGVGMLCAVLWVALSFSIAPHHKLVTAFSLLIPGAWLAWFVIGESTLGANTLGLASFFQTRVPVYLAWWAAFATIGVLWFLTRHHLHNSTPPSPLRGSLGVVVLAVAVALFAGVVLPAAFIFWQFTVYCGTRHLIENGNEEEAIVRVVRIHRTPLYDLDWTLPRAIARVPFAYPVYSTLVCCPTCKGHWATPFLLAARHGKLRLLDKIIGLRGSIECGDDKGTTVLHHALLSKDPSVVRFVVSRGADVNAQGQLPMGSSIHHAVFIDSPPAVIEVLLDAGADVNATDTRGWTPFDWARIWNTNAIPFLESIGAKGGTNHTSKLPVRSGDKPASSESQPVGD